MALEHSAIASRLRKILVLTGPSAIWKLLAAIFALLNLRHLPFGWHIRVFYLFHVRPKLPLPPARPASIFQPMILTTRSTLYETDYNMHKSNSTYFTDFDMGRSLLVTWVSMNGLRQVAAEMNAANKTTGRINIHLGSVMCNFKREIKTFEQFELWTRILTWDRKWAYVVSHWVRKGSAKPKGFVLQPWRNVNGKNVTTLRQNNERESTAAQDTEKEEQNKPYIYATALAKGVFKKGRLTIPPERIFQASELIPPKPEGTSEASIPPTPSPDPQAKTSESTTVADVPDLAASPTLSRITSKEEAEAVIGAALIPSKNLETWDWDRVEEERLKGLKLAEMFRGLEDLEETFSGDMVLGQYNDVL